MEFAAENGRTGGRVLVVEDDPGVCRILHELFTRDGLDVATARTAAEMEPAIERWAPGVILLDLGLPDRNGFDVLRELRTRHEIPVIVLSGRADESDRVLALEFGADDYVVKPFLNRELVARVRVRLRRPPAAVAPAGTVDPRLAIDQSSREVVVDGEALSLTAKEFDLLAYLTASPRQVFSRAQLLEAVWASSPDWQSESTVTEHIHRLRQKVGGDRIATVRGVGYRFDPRSAAADEDGAA